MTSKNDLEDTETLRLLFEKACGRDLTSDELFEMVARLRIFGWERVKRPTTKPPKSK